MASQERPMLYWRSLIDQYLPPQWKALDNSIPANWEDEAWSADYDKALRAATQQAMSFIETHGTHFNLYEHEVQSSSPLMRRFLTLTTAESTHQWLARMMMETRGVKEGDMLNLDLRHIGSNFDASDALSIGPGSNNYIKAIGTPQPRVKNNVKLRNRKA